MKLNLLQFYKDITFIKNWFFYKGNYFEISVYLYTAIVTVVTYVWLYIVLTKDLTINLSLKITEIVIMMFLRFI